MKKNMEFLELVVKLEPIEFLGLAKVLGVKIYEVKDGTDVAADARKEDIVAKDGVDLVAEVCEKFLTLPRQRRREILRVMKKSIKEA